MAESALKASQKTILLVEDDAITALLTVKQLRCENYQVTHEPTGESAIAFVRENPGKIDLVLMDIDLGEGLDGTETAREILKIRDIPILFLSSHTEKAVVDKTESISSYGYVVKDSSFTVLDASIKMAFKLFETRSLYYNTFEYSINGLCVHRMLYDANGEACDCEYLKVNAAFGEQTGVDISDLVGKTIRGLYPGEQGKGLLELYQRVLSEGTPVQEELFFDPLKQWFQLSIFPMTNDEFTVVVENISARKQAEEELRKKIDEMERFQRLTVDREIMMITLKQEINDLQRELGRTPTYVIRS